MKTYEIEVRYCEMSCHNKIPLAVGESIRILFSCKDDRITFCDAETHYIKFSTGQDIPVHHFVQLVKELYESFDEGDMPPDGKPYQIWFNIG